MHRSKGNQGGHAQAPQGQQLAASSTQNRTEKVKLTLEQWSTQLAPLSDVDKASVTTLGEWIDGQKKAHALGQRRRTSQSDDVAATGGSMGLNGHAQSPATRSEAGRSGKLDDSLEAGSLDRKMQAALPSKPLSDTAAYQAWIASLEDHIFSTNESSYVASVEQVTRARKAVDAILEDIERAAVHVSELRAGCQYVEEGTMGLREDAETQLEKMDRLHELAEGLSLRRSYFALLPGITRFLSSPSPDLSLVLAPDFLHNLDKLDVALSFVAAHEHYKDANLYRMRFEQCIVRAASLIRMWLFRWTADWTTKTQEGLKIWQTNKIRKGKEKERPDSLELGDPRMELAELAIQSLFFDPQINETAQIRTLLVELEKRSRKLGADEQIDSQPSREQQVINRREQGYETVFLPEVGPILTDCRTSLFTSRQSLLANFVNASFIRIDAFVASEGAVGSAPSSSTPTNSLLKFLDFALRFAIPLCADEEELCSQMMDIRPPPEGLSSGQCEFVTHMEALVATPLLDKLKIRLAKETELATLARACHFLWTCQLDPPADTRPVDSVSLRRTLAPVLKEVRARLLSRAQAVIASHVAAYMPSPADLDYFDNLKLQSNGGLKPTAAAGHRRRISSIGGAGLLGAAIDAEEESTSSPTSGSPSHLFTKPSNEATRTWYPAFFRTFEILAVLHKALSSEQLRDAGSQALRSCLSALRNAARIMQQCPAASTQSTAAFYSDLFLLRHVLLLREALVSLDVAVQHLQEREAEGGAFNSAQINDSAPGIDLSVLVSALSTLWASTGALLDPRRLVQASNQREAETESDQVQNGISALRLSNSAISKELKATLQSTSAAVRDYVVRSASFPLRVFLDTASKAIQGELQSNLDTSAEKATNAFDSFQTTARAALTDAEADFSLYLGDDLATENLLRGTVEELQEVYEQFSSLVSQAYSLVGLKPDVSDAIGWRLTSPNK
ncbi:hypothetical protein K437DRAFT_132894 [Tilletiaria anomala UBC 951]|uniref:Conserved oligomeric Golgi complex subunit 3 n=1 Tax=Tilletiaria anomala (strain ATCC 24038 / CBS 436.72 / UBC 951) TaxID=1037660 RepID=A0A066WK46_TILAU|nr:uncharacterized protein K437DRAFT_132894 [Tilletiaria anomala UBC 951]KDN52938.1 hypothetical protein K437DRAFT_132894 [Tilletiaria anomala UBC 951]